MHLHILGICGTFMGGIAAIAKAMGHKVTGSDQGVYPPMSTQLEALGIELTQGYDPAQLDPEPDVVIIGNAMSRGNPCVEAVLERGMNYTSGPQWLKENVLKDKWVLAVAGTHGKTTTASMLAWILDYAGLNPGFLIGGVVPQFDASARLTESPFFVIEADEYDTAFFDKRSKFVHYLPRTFVLNNLEFDHADIFADLAAIQTQFHHVIRTIPQTGKVIYPRGVTAVEDTLAKGLWSDSESLGGHWQVAAKRADASVFEVSVDGEVQGQVAWQLIGEHNMHNGVMAIAAARHAGVPTAHAIAALNAFQAPKRRLEKVAEVNGVTVYDDFAHHPTAITTTLKGMKAAVDGGVLAVFEPRSNTMKMGVHQDTLIDALDHADACFIYQDPALKWDLHAQAEAKGMVCESDIDALVKRVVEMAPPRSHIVVMSNGGFFGIHQRIATALNAKG